MPLDVSFRRAFYRPGEPVALTVTLDALDDATASLRLWARASHLRETVQEVAREVSASALAHGVSLSLALPPTAPRGYGLDISLRDAHGVLLAQHSAAFDVLNGWTEAPRYGFLSDFAPGRDDAQDTMQQLARYHVNALQFYDWMYRHDTLLPPQELYVDPLGRALSLRTVRALIDAAHAYNMAAMPYTAVYAASPAFYEQHPEWGLYQKDGTAHWFADGFLAYMDPRPDSGWTRHLLAQFDEVLRETAFDGIHLDQYGAPRLAYDADGHTFGLEAPLAKLIAATKEVVKARRSDGAVVFNCVTNWPVRTAAPAPQDLVYIEVWEPFVTLSDLHRLVIEAQRLGGGKPVVLAAYIDPAWEHNMRLMDATIFASGGARIELGEHCEVLADPYFPKHRPMTPQVAASMRRLYDFAVRYQDVIGPRTGAGHAAYSVRVTLGNANVGSGPGHVWPIVRQGADATAINLINLQGMPHGRWDRELDAPRTTRDVQVEVKGITGDVSAAWWASPDGNSLAPQMLEIEREQAAGGLRLSFTLPSLDYWDLIVLETV